MFRAWSRLHRAPYERGQSNVVKVVGMPPLQAIEMAASQDCGIAFVSTSSVKVRLSREGMFSVPFAPPGWGRGGEGGGTCFLADLPVLSFAAMFSLEVCIKPQFCKFSNSHETLSLAMSMLMILLMLSWNFEPKVIADL